MIIKIIYYYILIMSIRKNTLYSENLNKIDTNMITGDIVKLNKNKSLSESISLLNNTTKYKALLFIKEKSITYSLYYEKYQSIDKLEDKSKDKINNTLNRMIKSNDLIEVILYRKYVIIKTIFLLRYAVLLYLLHKYNYILIDLDDPEQKCLMTFYIIFYFIILLLFEKILFKILYTIYDIVKLPFKKSTVSIEDRITNCLSDYDNKDYYCEFRELPNSYLNYPLSHFYIASSNKSYLPCGLLKDTSSIQNIDMVLRKGARYIHLDIHHDGKFVNDGNAEPIVTNNQNKQNSVLFKDCCKLINKRAWNLGENNNKNSYPLFLYLNINIENIAVLNKISQYITDIFVYELSGKTNTRLLNKVYGYAGRNIIDNQNSNSQYNKLGHIKLGHLMNSIIIITNKFPITNSLDEITNATFDESNKYIQNYEYTDNDLKYNNMPNPKSGFGNKKNMINYNKTNLTRVFKYDGIYKPSSKHTPKKNIRNIHPLSPFNLGCQFICMNYQKYDSNCKTKSCDNAMELYMNTLISSTDFLKEKWAFKHSPILLKPSHLRSKLQPKHTNNKQDPTINAKIQSVDSGFGNSISL
jgi:hypothetical protein